MKRVQFLALSASTLSVFGLHHEAAAQDCSGRQYNPGLCSGSQYLPFPAYQVHNPRDPLARPDEAALACKSFAQVDPNISRLIQCWGQRGVTSVTTGAAPQASLAGGILAPMWGVYCNYCPGPCSDPTGAACIVPPPVCSTPYKTDSACAPVTRAEIVQRLDALVVPELDGSLGTDSRTALDPGTVDDLIQGFADLYEPIVSAKGGCGGRFYLDTCFTPALFQPVSICQAPEVCPVPACGDLPKLAMPEPCYARTPPVPRSTSPGLADFRGGVRRTGAVWARLDLPFENGGYDRIELHSDTATVAEGCKGGQVLASAQAPFPDRLWLGGRLAANGHHVFRACVLDRFGRVLHDRYTFSGDAIEVSAR